MQALVSAVGTQAMAMTEKLNDYEALLQGITAVGEQVMQEPAPDVPEQVVYKYYGIGMKPDIVPEYAIRSEIYHNKVSLKHADFSAPPETIWLRSSRASISCGECRTSCARRCSRARATRR